MNAELRHIIEAQQFSREWLENEFFPLTDEMRGIFKQGGCDILSGKRMISFFYEPSTRTRASFEFAMDYLGGNVVFSTENATQFSSVAKGETLRDTITVLNRYGPDVIVLRYNEEGGAKIAAEASSVPIINAGDGSGQHPTQALLDLYTIRRKLGRIDGILVAMIGDLFNGRTVRSLCYLLGKFSDIRICFIAPDEAKMKEDIKDYLRRHNVSFVEGNDLRVVAPEVDVFYQTRTQKERGTNISAMETGLFVINGEVLDSAKDSSIIMHPLPRVGEITLEVDSDSRAVYLTDQIDSGVFTRMAELKMLLS